MLQQILDINAKSTAVYAADTTMTSRFEILKMTATRMEKAAIQPDMTTSCEPPSDDECGRVAKGATRKATVSAAVIMRPAMLAMRMLFWCDHR